MDHFEQFWAIDFCDVLFWPEIAQTIIELYNQRFLGFNFPKQIGQRLYFWGSSWEYYFMVILVVRIEFLETDAWYRSTFYTLHL